MRSARGARRADPGFGLVELMVAVAIGLLAILVITSVFMQSQRQNRSTTGTATTQENALIALVMVERDLRMAGIGLVGVGCATVNGYDPTLATPGFGFAPMPVTIARDAATRSDVIAVNYGGSPFGNSPTTLTAAIATSGEAIRVANGNGFAAGDLILLSSPPGNCALLRATADAALAGGVWTIPHAVPPVNIFTAGYPTGARVTNLGAMVRRQYFVQGASLMMQDSALPDPVPIVDGVVAMRAQYGLDINGNGNIVYDSAAPANASQLVAIRIAVVARSGHLERELVSPDRLRLWSDATESDGGELPLDEDARRYRYRVYETVVPLRNVIWNTP